MVSKLKRKIHLSRFGRSLVQRFGPAARRVPVALRRRVVFQNRVPSLPDARVWHFGEAENVQPQALSSRVEPTLGHELSARPYCLAQPFVAQIKCAWLVGQHATPFTTHGKMLLTPFRNSLGFLSLEEHPELVRFVEEKGWKKPFEPQFSVVCSLVNRLDPNYFHWLTEWCTQLQALEHYTAQTGEQPQILVRADGPRFLKASLELLGYSANRVLDWSPQSPPCAMEKLIVPSLRGNSLSGSPRAMQWLRERFLNACDIDASAPSSASANCKIYVGRKVGGWRYVENQDEVEAFLEAHGFESVQAENLSFADQIRLFAQARLIVGMHGAGLTNILFAPHAHLLELMGSYGDGAWYNMASALGQPYTLLNMPIKGENIVVDLKLLGEALARIEGQ